MDAMDAIFRSLVHHSFFRRWRRADADAGSEACEDDVGENEAKQVGSIDGWGA